jgi:hypothetical protein
MADEPEDGPELEADPVEIPNAADRKRVARIRDKNKRAAEQEAALWRAILADPVGRRLIWSWLMSMRTFTPTWGMYRAGAPGPEATWWNTGRRDAGQELYLKLLRIDILAVQKMHTEHDPNFAKPKPARERKEEATDGTY